MQTILEYLKRRNKQDYKSKLENPTELEDFVLSHGLDIEYYENYAHKVTPSTRVCIKDADNLDTAYFILTGDGHGGGYMFKYLNTTGELRFAIKFKAYSRSGYSDLYIKMGDTIIRHNAETIADIQENL